MQSLGLVLCVVVVLILLSLISKINQNGKIAIFTLVGAAVMSEIYSSNESDGGTFGGDEGGDKPMYKKIDISKFDKGITTLSDDTEDQETVRGWFADDISTADKKKLQVVRESIFSLSRKEANEKLIESIKSVLSDESLNKLTITDATANVGGNTLAFAKEFKAVNAVELDGDAFKALENNIAVAKCKNVNATKGSYLGVMNKLKQDVIFFDPPWGGVGYWKEENLMLKLDDKPIYDIINDIKDEPKLVIVKAPKNFALAEFKEKVKSEHVWSRKVYNHQMVFVKYGSGPKPEKSD